MKKSQRQLHWQGSFGNSVEELWTQGIIGSIENKTKKLIGEDFELFNENWLLIYDNQDRPHIDKTYILRSINKPLINYWTTRGQFTFSKIIIDSGNYYYQAEKDKKLKISEKLSNTY